MNQTSDKIINKIKQEHLRPMPKWKFWLRDGGLWAGLGLFILLAAASLGLLGYFWADEPWLVGTHIGFGLFFSRMPIVFLILIMTGLILALYDFRNTGRGYKYSFVKIGLALLAVVALASWSFNYLGVSQRLDKFFGASPIYQNREAFMKKVWQDPGSGLIAGQIIEIDNSYSFVFRDLSGKAWSVDSTDAVWRHDLKPEIGLQLKMIGTVQGDNFRAVDIRPWMGPGCGKGQGYGPGAGSCGMR